MSGDRIFELTAFAILLLVGLFANKLSDGNSRFPRIIALIGGGAIVGSIAQLSDTSYIITSLSEPSLVRFVVDVALALVLFREGLELNLIAFRKNLRSVLILAFGGFILTSIIFAGTITLLTSFPFVIALLIAGIMAPTDPAATFSVFKGGLRLKEKEKNILGSESALNDAVAIVFVLEVFLTAAEDGSIDISAELGFKILSSFFGGILLGYLLGILFLNINKTLHDDTQTIILSLALVLTAFVTAVLVDQNFIKISSAITSLTAGAVFGNPQFFKFSRFPKASMNEFQEHISEVGEIIAFGAVGTLFSFTNFWFALLLGFLYAIVILISRFLVVVYILRIPSGLTEGESIFIAWGGMRGLATGVLAIAAYETYITHGPEESGLPIDPLVFLTSILIALIIMTAIQGGTLKIVGKRTKSITISNKKADLLLERRIIISKLAFYQKERDNKDLSTNAYKELTIPLRDRLSQIYHELQMETISRGFRMREYVKELEMITTVIIDLGIDQDNIELHEMHKKIKEEEEEILQKIQNEVDLAVLESDSSRLRSIDVKQMTEILLNTRNGISTILEKSSSSGTIKLLTYIDSILTRYVEPEEIAPEEKEEPVDENKEEDNGKEVKEVKEDQSEVKDESKISQKQETN